MAAKPAVKMQPPFFIVCITVFILGFHFQEGSTATKAIGQRIINGKEASRGQFPWQAALFIDVSGSTRTCGGSLISDQWILTAGHCVYRGRSFTVYLGSISLVDDDPSRIVLTTTVSVLHEQYAAVTLSNDIGLVYLQRPLLFTDTIRPIVLPESPLTAGTPVTISGWGLTSDVGDGSSATLNYANLVIIPDSECRKAFGQLGDEVACGKGANGEIVATCEGDSGGPVVTNINTYPVLNGVVSFGSSEGCESGQPEGYAKTFYYREWIRNKTKI